MKTISEWTTGSFFPRMQVALKWAKEYSISEQLLDVGCNDCVFGEQARKLGFRVTGADMNPAFQDYACSLIDEFAIVDVESKWPFESDKYGCIHMGALLEHVYHYNNCFTESRRTLADDGLLIISAPNVAHWKHRIQLLCGQCPKWFSPEHFEHIRMWTHANLRQALENNGFEVIKSAACYERGGSAYDLLARLAPTYSSIIMMAARKC